MTSTNTARADRLAKKLATDLAGCLVWWDFEEVRLSVADARRVIAAHGFDAEISVPAITDEQGVRRAASEFNMGRSDRWKAEVVGDYADGTLEVGLLQHVRLSHDKAAARKVEWTQQDSVVFDRNASTWLYSGTTPASAAFIALADERRGYLTHDFVRSAVVFDQLAKLGAFPLRRRQGGFFFVPAVHADRVQKLAALVRDLPCDAYLNIAHIAATDDSVAGIGQAAREHVQHGLGELKSRLAAWRELQRVPRSDALENAMTEFHNLKAQAELYRDALGLELGDLEEEIACSVGTASELLGLAAKGLPQHFLVTVKALHTNFGEVEIPYSAVEGLGLPGNASNDRAQNWWSKDRGAWTAAEVGLTATATRTGVTLRKIVAEQQVEQAAA